MMIRPTILYAAPVWCSAAHTTIKNLQVFQNKCLRLILSEDRYARIDTMHEKTNIPVILEHVKKISEHFYKNGLGENALVKNLTNIRKHNASFKIKHRLPYQAPDFFNEIQ